MATATPFPCREHAGKVLDEARAMAEHIGISAELLHVPNAHPATAIIETAKSRGCDLIVMASHGRRGIRKLLLGSQTSEARRRDQSPRAKRKGLGSIRPECVNQPDRPACAWPFRVGLLRQGTVNKRPDRKTEPAYPRAVLAQRGSAPWTGEGARRCPRTTRTAVDSLPKTVGRASAKSRARARTFGRNEQKFGPN